MAEFERPTSREFGRDGISGMVNRDRAIRATEVSQPRPEHYTEVQKVLGSLLARAKGRRPDQRPLS